MLVDHASVVAGTARDRVRLVIARREQVVVAVAALDVVRAFVAEDLVVAFVAFGAVVPDAARDAVVALVAEEKARMVARERLFRVEPLLTVLTLTNVS